MADFLWDAQRLYRWDGDRFEQFLDEPWTADNWWYFQASHQILYSSRVLGPLTHKLYNYRVQFLRTPNPSASFFMQTRHNYRHSAQRRVTQGR